MCHGTFSSIHKKLQELQNDSRVERHRHRHSQTHLCREVYQFGQLETISFVTLEEVQ